MAQMASSVAVLCVIVALQVTSTLAGRGKKGESASCKQFDLSITKLEVCPESLVTFQDFNVTLSDKCEIIPTGCVTSKAFDTAQITWDITTTARIAQGGHEHITGESDACKDLENIPEDALAIMKAMQLKTACPMPDANQCATPEHKVDMKKYKKFIPLMWLATGTITGDINIKYNNGNGTSCVKFEAALVNKNGRAKKSKAEIMAGQMVAKTLASSVLQSLIPK